MIKRSETIINPLTLFGFILIFIFALGIPRAYCGEGEVMIIDLEGAISPGSATFLTRGLDEAQKRGFPLVVIRLDTPGGLGSSMRSMVKAILNSEVPVVVFPGEAARIRRCSG